MEKKLKAFVRKSYIIIRDAYDVFNGGEGKDVSASLFTISDSAKNCADVIYGLNFEEGEIDAYEAYSEAFDKLLYETRINARYGLDHLCDNWGRHMPALEAAYNDDRFGEA